VSIVEQNPTWNQFEGLWKITIKNYEGDGTPALPTPYNAAIDQGVPYTRDDVVGFYNHSLIGSRMSINRYYVFNPAPEAFCNQTFEPPFLNVAGPGVCGVNGYAFTAGQYGTSTHDNNGKSGDERSHLPNFVRKENLFGFCQSYPVYIC
jgi:hypothetical protein